MRKLILRNLLRNKRRTLLTLASLVLATTLVCFFSAFVDMMRRADGAADNRIVVRSAVSLNNLLPESFWNQLAELPGVREVTPLTWFNGVYKDQKAENFFPRFAADPATLFRVYSEFRLEPDQLAAWSSERNAVIAGAALAARQGWKLGDRIALQGDIYPANLDLVLRGIYTVPDQPSQEGQIYFQRAYLEEALGNPGLAGTYIVKVNNKDDVPEVIRAAEARFANSEAPVRAETERAFQLAFLEMLGNVRRLFTTIGLAVVISILFVVANTMAMAAREKTREVAVLKTLGFGPSKVVSLVVGESVCLAILGSLLGVFLANFLIGGAAAGMQKIFPVFGTLTMTPTAWALGVGIGVLVGFISGAVPGWAAARLGIVDGLRRVA